jgi:hypothetical protein
MTASSGAASSVQVHGDATPDEVAAIVAAIESTWPRAAATAQEEAPRWRFSGRWWTKPVPVRRDRP